MTFLRRWFPGRARDHGDDDATRAGAAPVEDPTGPGSTPEADERDRERELLRAEAERLDELQQRQLRYADMAWTPPAQGGERRADDEDPGRER
jgi:hypothetical protein